MGEVYRAHDTKLNRDVALKVLPSAFASDPERMARFKRQAQLGCSLWKAIANTAAGLIEAADQCYTFCQNCITPEAKEHNHECHRFREGLDCHPG